MLNKSETILVAWEVMLEEYFLQYSESEHLVTSSLNLASSGWPGERESSEQKMGMPMARKARRKEERSMLVQGG